MFKETARRARLEPRTSRSGVRVVNRSATHASAGIAINRIMYKKFPAQKEHLGKCKWRVVVVVVRGGRRSSSKFTSDQGMGRAKLAFVDKGRYVIQLYVSLIFEQDGYCTVLNNI